MAFTLPELPFPKEALAPHMSAETFDYHYGKHHKAYVDKANELTAGTEFETMPIEEVIKKSSGKVFNNVAQIWNHTFFWNCLTPNKDSAPSARLEAELGKAFGSVDEFKKKFTQAAIDTFGSGWAWLVKNQDGSLAIVSTQGAGNPMTSNQQPLLTADVWEHAYYIDYRNARPKYLENFWALCNWEFVEKNLG